MSEAVINTLGITIGSNISVPFLSAYKTGMIKPLAKRESVFCGGFLRS